MRRIFLDTETTGLSAREQHRILALGAVAYQDRRPEPEEFYTLINPEREVDAGAQQVHGIGREQLLDQPLFRDIMADFEAYVADADEIVIFNAPFDLGFLDAEYQRAGVAQLPWPPERVVDALPMARGLALPGQKSSLDAVCARYRISISERSLHGALIDSKLLARVYFAMLDDLERLHAPDLSMLRTSAYVRASGQLPQRVLQPSEEELTAHQQLRASLGGKK